MMVTLNDWIKDFVEFLQIEKNASSYTIKYYQDDLMIFNSFLFEEAIDNVQDVDIHVVRLFFTRLYNHRISRRSVSRTISSIRTLSKFMERQGDVSSNPFNHVVLHKQEKNIAGFLYMEELSKLFEANDVDTATGQRDSALLELLYATGIRVSECQKLQLDSIDFTIGTVLVQGKGRKER